MNHWMTASYQVPTGNYEPIRYRKTVTLCSVTTANIPETQDSGKTHLILWWDCRKSRCTLLSIYQTSELRGFSNMATSEQQSIRVQPWRIVNRTNEQYAEKILLWFRKFQRRSHQSAWTKKTVISHSHTLSNAVQSIISVLFRESRSALMLKNAVLTLFR